MLYQLLVLVVAICHVTDAGIQRGTPTDTYRNCIQHPYRLASGYAAQADEQYDWKCLQQSYQREYAAHGGTTSKGSAISNFYGLWNAMYGSNTGATCPNPRVRKEYRVMTDAERATYHRAVSAFKAETDVTFNYDALASLHVGNPGAHGGPAFFNWHRIYLQMYEAALIKYEADVILPYWASSWDNEMANPTSSIMWDQRFAGNGNGLVTCGFPAGWVGPAPSQLTRNVGAAGGLITQMDINNVMSQNALVQIAAQLAAPQNNLESHHGKVHVFVGGQMSQLNTASYDPAFFNHHAFIDCIYEQFRLRQIANGVNPDTDWPVTWPSSHGPNDLISFDFPNAFHPGLTNIAVSQRLHACATYEPNCAELLKCDCDNACPTPYLTCDRARQICIPIQGRPCGGGGGGGGDGCCGSDGYGYGGGANGGTGYSPYTGSDGYSRPNDRYRPPPYGPNYRTGGNLGVQNTYCIGGGRCDTSYWSYMPINIYAYRPPSTDTYNSYPIQNGAPQQYDIYDPRGYPTGSTGAGGDIYRENRDRYSPSPAYNNCPCRSTTGGVYIQSYGNSYEGEYREYVPVDNRQPVYTTTGYVGVMNPAQGGGTSSSYIRVYDECGRACRARCRYDGSSDYVDCENNGIVELTDTQDSTQRPTYAPTYQEATQLSYTYSSVTRNGNTYNVPTYEPRRASMEFYCDYEGGALYDATASEQTYDMEGYLGDTTYRPPPYDDPAPYVPNPGAAGRYY